MLGIFFSFFVSHYSTYFKPVSIVAKYIKHILPTFVLCSRVLGAILSLMQHSLSTRGIASVGKRYGRRSSDQRLGTWRKLPKGRDHGVIKEEGAHAHPGKDSIDEGVAKSAGDGDEVSMTMEALEAVVHSVQEFIKATEVESAKQAREALRALAALLRAAGKGHAAMHDVVLLYASTQVFMEQTEYTAFSSQLCNVSLRISFSFNLSSHKGKGWQFALALFALRQYSF